MFAIISLKPPYPWFSFSRSRLPLAGLLMTKHRTAEKVAALSTSPTRIDDLCEA